MLTQSDKISCISQTLFEPLIRGKPAIGSCFQLHLGGVVEPVVHAFVHLINVLAFLAHRQLLGVT